jgi:hypothetical protein
MDDAQNVIAIKHRLEELESKYCDLIWFARSDNNTQNANIREKQREVIIAHLEECKSLQCPKTSDWQHGFNSGMLAATRLIASYVQSDDEFDGVSRKERISYAEEEFPLLDT